MVYTPGTMWCRLKLRVRKRRGMKSELWNFPIQEEVSKLDFMILLIRVCKKYCKIVC